MKIVERGKVAAGGESTTGTGENDDPYFIICLGGIEVVYDAFNQIETHGVETLGTVHGDDGYIALFFVEDCFVFCHFITSFRVRFII